jgi:hypothetical protein
MSEVCRVGDIGIGICYAHKHPVTFTTVFFQGDPITSVNDRQMMRIGDLGHTSCGHITRATTGSSTVFGLGDQAVHRVGDKGIVLQGGNYTAVTGSPNVFAGDSAGVVQLAPGTFLTAGTVFYDNSYAGQKAADRSVRKYMPQETDSPAEDPQRPYQSCGNLPAVIDNSVMPTLVSKNFRLATCKNVPCDQRGLTANQIACNWLSLCQTILDPARDAGFNFNFNSGFRTVQSGMGNTDHGLGCAADISMSSTQDTIRLFKWLVASGLPFSQIIYEKHNSAWVHVSYRGKAQGATRVMWTYTGGAPYGHGGANGESLPSELKP